MSSTQSRKDISAASISSSGSGGSLAATSSKMPLADVDLDSKYSVYFHKVTEFPPPMVFLNVPKVNPSEVRLQQTAGSQQPSQQRQ